ncbi:MAG: S53 family peptidase [Chthoniobacter sp.]
MAAPAAAPAPNIANKPPYLVPEILKAYHADGLGLTGAGETIAILIDTVPKAKDLKGFWKQNGLPDLSQNVSAINVNNVHLPKTEGEETLDAEWTSGIAPGAKIRIYASGGLDFVSLDKALDQILKELPNEPGLHQLSISLGLGETIMRDHERAEVDTEHQKFARLAAAGVNIFVSTGDAGSNPGEDGHSTGSVAQAEYQSSDSAVVAVGGTTLVLGANGQIASERGWADGGGGVSIFFDRPIWQTGDGLDSGAKRVVPDVSLAADPNTGAFVFFQNSGQQIGGTSWSAPVWAGFCALINERRSKNGKQSLAFLNPLIYPLNHKPAFNDIVTGNNGEFSAGAGHDLVTGLGTPNFAELLKALEN